MQGRRAIKEEFGTEKALGYLLGEKLASFAPAADNHPEFARELPNFVAEIKRIFEPWEVRECLENIRRVAAKGCDQDYIYLSTRWRGEFVAGA